MPSLKDPTSVAIGSTAVTDVLSLQWGVDKTPLNSRADDDAYDTIAEFTGGSVAGSVTFRDPVMATAFEGLSGTLTATLAAMGGGASKTLTITNIATGGAGNTVSKDAVANATVPFVARSSDGAINPVAIT